MSNTANTLKKDLRDYKLNILINESPKFLPDLKRLRKGKNILFSKPYWEIIKQWKGKGVITGSAALYAFGLLDRLPKDIDLLVFEKPSLELSTNRYIGMEAEKEMMGFYVHKGLYNVDLFEYDDESIIEKDGYLFHNPIEIIECKLSIMDLRIKNDKMKDVWDVIDCLKRLIPNYEFEE